ncbi:hypothetical protein PoB_005522200 [Plakobranchus ocellatus]|uniref:Uncharacterized protein n=1 Tax=Plakobranchus ocellatus TaxID=259542 RepID=A0AAV4CBI5_9GAST|nr:hypothetical protein PoB_005522200 [Plakobranchus ocellatus]
MDYSETAVANANPNSGRFPCQSRSCKPVEYPVGHLEVPDIQKPDRALFVSVTLFVRFLQYVMPCPQGHCPEVHSD